MIILFWIIIVLIKDKNIFIINILNQAFLVHTLFIDYCNILVPKLLEKPDIIPSRHWQIIIEWLQYVSIDTVYTYEIHTIVASIHLLHWKVSAPYFQNYIISIWFWWHPINSIISTWYWKHHINMISIASYWHDIDMMLSIWYR